MSQEEQIQEYMPPIFMSQAEGGILSIKITRHFLNSFSQRRQTPAPKNLRNEICHTILCSKILPRKCKTLYLLRYPYIFVLVGDALKVLSLVTVYLFEESEWAVKMIPPFGGWMSFKSYFQVKNQNVRLPEPYFTACEALFFRGLTKQHESFKDFRRWQTKGFLPF